MKKKIFLRILAFWIFLLSLCACAGSSSQTSIENASLYLDAGASQPTETYGWLDVFYCMVDISNPDPDAQIKASWVVVDTDRTRPNQVIKIEEKPADRDQVLFTLENYGNFWPTGDYRLYLYVNDREAQILEFKVVMAELPG
jgi:hypothetical protein